MIEQLIAVALAFVGGWFMRGDWVRTEADPHAELRELAPNHPSLMVPTIRLVGSRRHLWDYEVDG